MKPWTIGKLLDADVEHYKHGCCNLRGAIGYLFNPNGNNTKIVTGMFCNWLREIKYREWTYYYDFEKKQVFKLEKGVDI